MTIRDEDDAFAAEYVLGTLRGVERVEFEKRMKEDPAVRVAVENWQDRLQPLAEQIAPVNAPDRVWAQLSRRLGFGDTKTAAFGFGVRAWLAAALVVAVGVVAWGPLSERLLFSPDVQLSLGEQAGPPLWKLEVDTRRNRVAVSALRDVSLAADKSFELWLLRDANQAPVSLGLMPVEMNDRKLLKASLSLQSGNGFAVSLEPRGGSPTHLPTGPVLYVQKVRLAT